MAYVLTCVTDGQERPLDQVCTIRQAHDHGKALSKEYGTVAIRHITWSHPSLDRYKLISRYSHGKRC